MTDLRFVLLSDGSSDRSLLPLLKWLLRVNGVQRPIQEDWADLRGLRRPPRGLAERLRRSVELYACDLLFVHRDAERESYQNRRDEVLQALEEAELSGPSVCVVPVRMQEAWLLFNAAAIRLAAGNPRGRMALGLPPVSQLEQVPDPKQILHDLLREASGLTGRRRGTLRVRQCAQRVSELIDDYGPLRALPAFRALEKDLRQTIGANGWATPT